jgi:MYXO-CTERM domain-containing protein
VRAYDLQHGRLLSKPIVDPREPEEKLQGFPVTRVSSEDGRWQYTLYSGEEPFIHALDTEGRTAVCIDMPASVNNDPSGVQLKLAGDTLTVAGAQPHAVVDLKTFKVSEPAAAAPKPKPTATPKPAADTDSGPSLVLWLLPLAVLGLVAVLARQRRQSATRARAAAGHSG